MGYKGYDKTYSFRKFKTIHIFADDIRANFIKIYTANNEKNKLGSKTY